MPAIEQVRFTVRVREPLTSNVLKIAEREGNAHNVGATLRRLLSRAVDDEQREERNRVARAE